MSKQLTLYIAGPMSGYENFNFPAFFEAQAWLEQAGIKVWNPAEKDQEATLDAEAVQSGDAKMAVERGFDFREAFLWDVTKIIESDGIYMLKGWEHSPGARAEHAVATAMQKHYPEYQIVYQ